MKKTIALILCTLLCTLSAHADIRETRARLLIQEEDGSPSVRPRTLKVPNTSLTDNADSSASLDYGAGIGGAFTAGSVIFSDGTTLAEDNANLFWDDGNDVLECDSLSAPSGTLTLAGVGNTNNEALTIDCETSSNLISLGSTTSANLGSSISLRFNNDKYIQFGSGGSDMKLAYQAQYTNECFEASFGVGSTGSSGYFNLVDILHRGTANREPISLASNPTLRGYSSDGDEALDYWQIFHDQTNAVLEVGNGDLEIKNASVGIGTDSPLYSLDVDEIGNSAGDFKIQPDVQGDAIYFGDTDVGDAVDGKSTYFYRKAAEGDAFIRYYTDNGMVSRMKVSNPSDGEQTIWQIIPAGAWRLMPFGGKNVSLFEGNTVNSPNFKQYGPIDGAAEYIQWYVNDTTDNYELTRGDDKIGNFDVQMPLITDSVTRGDASQITWDVAPASDHTGTGNIASMTVDANTYGIASALHLDTDGNWIEADADAATTMPCTALALETGTGTKTVLLNGVMRDDTWNFTVGGIVYVSATTGTLTTTAPSGAGDQVQAVGIALSADVVMFTPDLTLVEVGA